MQRYIRAITLILLFGTAPILASGNSNNDNYYLKINKSFEIFGAVFRQIAGNYVNEIDPEDLVEQGINGMLSQLDPYTVFVNEDHSDDLDIITNGTYTGVGITVNVRNGILTIVGVHDGYSAKKNGIRIGDKIYKIDSTVVYKQTNEELRKYTNGKAGSELTMWVIRPGITDTL